MSIKQPLQQLPAASGTFAAAQQPFQTVTQIPSAAGSFPEAAPPAAFPPPPALQADSTANPFASAPLPQQAPQAGFETAPGAPVLDAAAAAAAAAGEGEEDDDTVRDINDALRGLFR